MRSILPLLFLAMPLVAEDVAPPKPPAPPTPDQRKEMQEGRQQFMAMREKAMQDPEVVKLKATIEEANKALRAKVDEVMAKEPGYAELKAKMDAAGGSFGMRPDGRPEKRDKKEKSSEKGGEKGPEGLPPTPAPMPMPAP
jgi:hypothetical protein